MSKVQIMIVEDDMIIAADISMQLVQLGYEVTGILPRGEDALQQLESAQPDIILMDINLKGELDGVETAQEIYDRYQLPLIYLTANADDATFQRARSTKPYAFISKPFEQSDLQRSIELVISRLEDETTSKPLMTGTTANDDTFILDDRIFVKQRGRMVKIFIKDILYAEADRSYCKVYTEQQEFLMTLSLKDFEERLQSEKFMRVHRSYVVNVTKIDEISDNHSSLIIGKTHVPVSRSFQKEITRRLRLF